MNFYSLYDQGFARVASVTIPVHPAQPARNAEEIIAAAVECSDEGVAVAVFPELSVSGYALDDLFLQPTLLDEVEEAIATIVSASAYFSPIIWVGAPLRHEGLLYNCAIAIHRGRILAVTPKMHLPNYREFYEKRYFTTPSASTSAFIDVSRLLPAFDPEGPEALPFDPISVQNAQDWDAHPTDYGLAFHSVPFGTVLITVEDIPGLVVSAEVCEDLWVPVPSSSRPALHGATLIVNLSASPVTVGRAAQRRRLVESTSSRLNVAYAYCAAGEGESTTDLSWDGQTLIYEAGDCLAQGDRFTSSRTVTIADIDLDRLVTARIQQNSIHDNAVRMDGSTALPTFTSNEAGDLAEVRVELHPQRTDLGLRRKVDRFPFVPDDPALLEQDCYEAYNIQISALAQRLRAIGNPKIIIGVSGGLDSTHALIVAAKAMDLLERPRTDILAYTLPGFATSEHTKTNAQLLCERLGTSFEEIDITPAARQMLTDMKHPFAQGADEYDVTFENVQAGLRTDYLFRLANHLGGLVLGTGDLSELALGWCTYGVGDHMSHSGVNAGIPKTMIQHLIRWESASGSLDTGVSEVLDSILDTEITPELIPTKPGEVPQSTEASIGPYNLQDFTLYHFLDRQARPSKIAFLAYHAWSDIERGEWPPAFPKESRVAYSLEDIVKWERLFLRRFFANQFKRSALPNGPKIMAGGSLSPRGDWRMPSDVSSHVWVQELDRAVANVLHEDAPSS